MFKPAIIKLDINLPFSVCFLSEMLNVSNHLFR